MTCALCDSNYAISISVPSGKTICFPCFQSIKNLESFAPNPFQEA